MWSFGFFRRRFAVQEFVFLLIFFAVAQAFRIVTPHLYTFFSAELRQVSNKVHQLPRILFGPCPANAGIPVKRTPFSTIQNSSPSVRFCVAACAYPGVGIQSAAELSIAAAIIAMAHRAVIREMQHRFAQIFWRGWHRIWRGPRARWYRKIPQVPCHKFLELAGIRSRAHPVVHDRCATRRNQPGHRHKYDQEDGPAFHVLHSDSNASVISKSRVVPRRSISESLRASSPAPSPAKPIPRPSRQSPPGP